MRARNSRTGLEISVRVVAAEGLATRMKGLIGRQGLEEGESLWIKPCMGVHTFGMRFPVDVLFLDGQSRVVAIKESMQPCRLSGIFPRARSVLELAAGSISDTGTTVGDTVLFED